MTRHAWIERTGWLLIGLGVVAAGLRIVGQEPLASIWTDRDLVRAQTFFQSWPTVGADLTAGRGASIPGGAQYLLMQPGLWSGDAVEGGQRWQLVLDGLGALVTAATAWRLRGALAGGVALWVWLTSVVVVGSTVRLWNPGFLGLPTACAVAATVLLGVRGDARLLVVVALASAVAAQVHLTGALVGVVLGLGCLTQRPEGWRRWSLASLGVVLAAYTPYLLAEASQGWPNTRAMRAQPTLDQLTGGPHPDNAPWSDLVQAFLWLVPGSGALAMAPHDLGWAWPGLGRPLAWAGALGLVAVWTRQGLAGGERAALRALSALTLGTVGVVVWDASAELHGVFDARYLFVAVPGLAVIAGVAVVEGVTRLGRAGWAVLAWIVLAVGAEASALPDAWLTLARRPDAWSQRREALEALAAQTSSDLDGLVGRTSIWIVDRDGPTSEALDAVDHLLSGPFPGSAAPPCHAILVGLDAAEQIPGLQASLATWLTDVQVLRVTPGPAWTLVTFTADTDRCPTSLVDRYVPTPVEREVRRVVGIDAPGVPRIHAAAREGGVRWIASLPLPGAAGVEEPLRVAIDVGSDGTAVLHAEALRGRSYNEGPLTSKSVEGPRLHIAGADGEVDVWFARGRVGLEAASTPLVVTGVTLPALPWRLTLSLDRVAGPRRSASEPVTSRDPASWDLGRWPEP